MEIHHPWDLPQYLTPTTTTTIVFPCRLFELFPSMCCTVLGINTDWFTRVSRFRMLIQYTAIKGISYLLLCLNGISEDEYSLFETIIYHRDAWKYLVSRVDQSDSQHVLCLCFVLRLNM